MQRRDFLKTSGVAASVAAFSVQPFNIIQAKSLSEEVLGHGKFKYRAHKNWGNLDPSKTPVKNCHEMVMDKKGRLIMITDEVKNNVLIYDKSGKLLDSWGNNYPGGHGLTLWDAGGEEFLFICDPQLPKVVKTTLDGKEVLTLPDPRTIGALDKDQKYKPTETTIGPNGDIYVADGYGSNYIFQFDSEGNFIRKFGGKGNADDQFSTAHGVTLDLRDSSKPSLLCTSRAHNSFKRFTLDGQYQETLFLPGAFVCRAVIDDDNVYAGVCWSRLKYLNRTNDSGFVTILDKNNKVISNPGGTAPKYRKGKLEMMVQDTPVFNHCHDVCVDEDKNLYICQWNANKTYPIKLERV